MLVGTFACGIFACRLVGETCTFWTFTCRHLLAGTNTCGTFTCSQILVGHLLVAKYLCAFTCRTFPHETFSFKEHMKHLLGNIIIASNNYTISISVSTFELFQHNVFCWFGTES